jgi:hypothetical protein
VYVYTAAPTRSTGAQLLFGPTTAPVDNQQLTSYPRLTCATRAGGKRRRPHLEFSPCPACSCTGVNSGTHASVTVRRRSGRHQSLRRPSGLAVSEPEPSTPSRRPLGCLPRHVHGPVHGPASQLQPLAERRRPMPCP